MHAVAQPAHPAHPSGIPGAPWRVGTHPARTIHQADGQIQLISARRAGETQEDVQRIVAAAAILPDLAASAAKLVAAYEAWMATVEGSADERTALDRWDEIAAVETGVIGGLQKAAGIPIPDGAGSDAPAATSAPSTDGDASVEADFRPGCTA